MSLSYASLDLIPLAPPPPPPPPPAQPLSLHLFHFPVLSLWSPSLAPSDCLFVSVYLKLISRLSPPHIDPSLPPLFILMPFCSSGNCWTENSQRGVALGCQSAAVVVGQSEQSICKGLCFDWLRVFLSLRSRLKSGLRRFEYLFFQSVPDSPSPQVEVLVLGGQTRPRPLPMLNTGLHLSAKSNLVTVYLRLVLE